MSRRARRRRLGVALVAFGASGVVLVLAAAVLVLGSFSAIDDAASGFERQRDEIVALLEPAAAALDRAATGAANAGSSLTATRDAAADAAGLTTRLAASFENLASLGSFEVFGLRPFAELSGEFAVVGGDARRVSADLSIAAEAMSTNVADAQAVAAELRSLADRLDQLRATLDEPADAGAGASDASLPITMAKLVLIGLLAWLAVPALASLWLGARLLRSRR